MTKTQPHSPCTQPHPPCTQPHLPCTQPQLVECLYPITEQRNVLGGQRSLREKYELCFSTYGPLKKSTKVSCEQQLFLVCTQGEKKARQNKCKVMRQPCIIERHSDQVMSPNNLVGHHGDSLQKHISCISRTFHSGKGPAELCYRNDEQLHPSRCT